ncbi:hypothetical protein F0231_04210 [Vibrio sp. RE86]|nr:hypothetical protein [Vibrio sp. RE86]
MNQLTSHCDVVFANSYFEFGRFLPVLFPSETKHILPVFILTCLSNFLAPPIWRCFFMSQASYTNQNKYLVILAG